MVKKGEATDQWQRIVPTYQVQSSAPPDGKKMQAPSSNSELRRLRQNFKFKVSLGHTACSGWPGLHSRTASKHPKTKQNQNKTKNPHKYNWNFKIC